MKRCAAILGLLVAIVGVSALPAYASHSMAGGAECGERSFSADLTKGRTDGMVVRAEYATGCKSYKYENFVGADCVLDESGKACLPITPGERGWQMAECRRIGKLDVANFFRFYFDTEINPDDVKVSCTPYSGPD